MLKILLTYFQASLSPDIKPQSVSASIFSPPVGARPARRGARRPGTMASPCARPLLGGQPGGLAPWQPPKARGRLQGSTEGADLNAPCVHEHGIANWTPSPRIAHVGGFNGRGDVNSQTGFSFPLAPTMKEPLKGF